MIDHKTLDRYQATIGIECHVQLKTKTKLFSGADNNADEAPPNTTVSPICFGFPGVLPVLNEQALVLAVRAGAALNATINQFSSFDRKHYFYPDLPKGYQITQLEFPTVGEGKIMVPRDDGTDFAVRITRAHIEEDAGKLTHPEGKSISLVDLNRAGTPLVEIVSEADIKSPADAKFYAQELYRLMTFADVTYGDLFHGNMRFDVNISVAPSQSDVLGTRAEVKNLNSFKSIERAAEFEMHRQIELLEKGEKIVQETRGWNDAKQKTFSQRSKEDAHDYRYFPDADIPPITLTDDYITSIKASMPLLPPYYRQQWQVLSLDHTAMNALLSDSVISQTVQRVLEKGGHNAARRVGLWFLAAIGEDKNEQVIKKVAVPDEYFIELASMTDNNELNSTAAKEVFLAMLRSTESPRAIANARNLIQVSDTSFIESVVEEVLADPLSQKAVEDIKSGNDKAIGFLVGQVMKRSGGKANPAMAQALIKQKI
jgi:aspartyl-tRNA(Asn)/glutamyl-tRNA(Gln) amidotransferase subunit B